MRRVHLVGLVVAAAGVLTLVLGSSVDAESAAAAGVDQATVLGDAVLLLSAFILGVKVVYTGRAVRTVSPGTLTLWHDIIGVGLFAVSSLVFEDWQVSSVQPEAIWALLFAGLVISGFCFASQAWLLEHYTASVISVFSFLTPVFGVVMSILLRGDPVSPWIFLAGAGVVIGIILVNRKS